MIHILDNPRSGFDFLPRREGAGASVPEETLLAQHLVCYVAPDSPPRAARGADSVEFVALRRTFAVQVAAHLFEVGRLTCPGCVCIMVCMYEGSQSHGI